ncbi:hypothetical protein FRC0485_00468 [Corynebacterium diphtheriae]|nr:hypothetical protein BHF97_05840 [Corynebacterium diphtheriae]CAB0492935.1 hypothetical protein CIP107505_00411 [Corynebacterium diphtheriae]CAB0494100.1 hypothetical protein CIP107502_00456 [Corynebacterium diphtheriae]CAB0633653.1 hypothetical protein CIP107566_00451 [Corynebacterium diphtheriae]CAB0674849.1 hypothetical protein FRC0026_00143 [Corynebacterium diphtheriae]
MMLVQPLVRGLRPRNASYSEMYTDVFFDFQLVKTHGTDIYILQACDIQSFEAIKGLVLGFNAQVRGRQSV